MPAATRKCGRIPNNYSGKSYLFFWPGRVKIERLHAQRSILRPARASHFRQTFTLLRHLTDGAAMSGEALMMTLYGVLGTVALGVDVLLGVVLYQALKK